MKLKKLLSTFLAFAVAVTTFSAFPVTADASMRTITIFKGEHSLDNDGMITITADEAFCFSGDVRIGITYEIEDATSNVEAQATVDTDSTYHWALLCKTYTVTSNGTSRMPAYNGTYETACENGNIRVDGDNLIIKEITITGEYNNPNEAPAADVGEQYVTVNGISDMGSICFNTQSRSERKRIEAGTHTYELNYTTKSYSDDLDYTGVVEGIDVQVLIADTTGAQNYTDMSIDIYVDGEKKVSIDEDTYGFKYNKEAMDYSIDEVAPGFMYDLRSADNTAIGTINAGSTVTFKVTVTYTPIEPYVEYQQYTEYTKNNAKFKGIRGLMLIPVEDAESAESVDFRFSNGTKEITVNSKKCYSKITVAGNTIVAADGYVFVAYAMSGVPDGTTVTCTGITVNK